MSQPKETTRFCRLLPFLNPNSPPSPSTSCPSKGFEAQSHSIVNSVENWDAFRQEAREKQITTAAGLKELLKERYTRKFSLDTSESLDKSEREEDTRPSIAPRQESYRALIRGNADHIMGLRLEPTKRSGPSKAKLSRMASKLSFSMSDFLPDGQQQKGEEDSQCRGDSLAKGLNKSRIGESSNLEVLLIDDGCTSLDSKGCATSDDVPMNQEANVTHGSDDSSDDDRSNNGAFEYYPKLKPTRDEALERRRSYRTKNDDVRQSLPPKCERFIGIIKAAGGTPMKKEQRISNNSKSCFSKSMPPTECNKEWTKSHVNLGGERIGDDIADLLYLQNVHRKNVKTAVTTTTSRSLELNSKILAELEREGCNATLRNQCPDTKEGNIISSIKCLNPRGASYSRSMPPNCESYLDAVDDHDRESHPSVRNLRQNSGVSKSLPPKTPHEVSIQAPRAVKSINTSVSSTKNTSSTADLSQITDGSELLVDWGECYDSDSNTV